MPELRQFKHSGLRLLTQFTHLFESHALSALEMLPPQVCFCTAHFIFSPSTPPGAGQWHTLMFAG
jgi:hypothetical protein